MIENIQNVNVFVASPSDVQKERDKVREIAEKINESVAGLLGYHLEVIGWEGVIPDLGDRAQEIINQQIGPHDIFVGIMWKRFGTPTGKADSGTEEELDIAMECKEKCGRPRIMFYFNQEPYTLQNEEEIEQMRKVIKFRDRLREEGLVWTYKGHDNFTEVVDKHLSKLIVMWSIEGKEKTKPIGITLKPYFVHPYPMQKNFTGRLTERELLTEWLENDPNPILAMIAFGGMGKSALSWYWLHDDLLKKGKTFEGIIWWSFYDKESSFESFLNHAILYVYLKKIDPKKIKSSREKMDILFEALSQRNFLLVLDGLERILRAYAGFGSPYQGDAVKEDERQDFRACIDPNAGIFLQMLSAGYPKTKTFITSRLFPKELDGIAGCRRVDLKRMSKEDAVEFFHRQGVKGTRAEIESCCEPYGYHPLSLRLLSGMIAEDPEKPGEIDQAKHCKIADTAPKEHFILKTAYEALDPPKQEFVSKLAAFRTPMEYKAIETFNTFGGKTEFNNVLKELVNRGLLLLDKEKKKYDLHPIVRSYCYDRLKDKEGVHSQLRDYFMTVPEPEKIESIDDLQPVIELYHHTVGAGRYDEAWNMFYDRLRDPLYFQFGNYQVIISLLKSLFTKGKGKTPQISDSSSQMILLHGMGNCHLLFGQPSQAIPFFELANKIAKEEENLRQLATGLGNLAYQQIAIGDMESAESNLRRRIEIAKEIDYELGKPIAISELGRIKSYTGNFEESNKLQKEAIDICEEINHVQRNSVNWAYRSLRALLQAREYGSRATGVDDSRFPIPDSLNEALDCAQKSLEFAKKWAEEEHPVEADFCWAYWLIGASHINLGNLVEAEKHLNEAIQRDRKINLVEIEVAILLELAKLRYLQAKSSDSRPSTRDSRLTESLNLATEALEIANRCGYVLQEADIHLFLAQYYKVLGDLEKAREYAELAKLRSHQMIDVKRGDYITKEEDTEYKYKPCYNEAVKLLEELK